MPSSLSQYIDKDQLRRSASLAAVAQALGIRVDDYGYAPCPFHDDHSPSFNIYETEDGLQRCGCFPCGFNGDVFDLVQKSRGRGFGDAIRFVARVMDESPQAQRVARRKLALDEDALRAYVAEAMALGATGESEGYLCVAAGLVDERSREYDAVLRQLGWGCDSNACVVMPHWDAARRLAGAKVRAPDGSRWAFPGSNFTSLYGSWMPAYDREILLLCEGETDHAHAQRELWSDRASSFVDVRSLPSGATVGKFPEAWVEDACRWERVYLAFDGDQAGYQATERWVEKFRERVFKPDLRRLPVPAGTDLRSCGQGVVELMRNAIAV